MTPPRPALVLPLLAAAAALLSGPALAQDMPKRKSGLWEIKTDMGGRAMQMQQCVDEKTDDATRQVADGMAKECTKPTIRREGDRVITESTCRFGGGTQKTRAVFSGKFDSAYRGEISMTYDPPMQGMKEMKMTIDARLTGPCKPGQKPGDMIMPGGMTMNINDMKK